MIIFLFGLAIALFTIQPWSYDLPGKIPLQVLFVWLLFLWLFFFRFPEFRLSLSIFSKIQWILIATIVFSMFIQASNNGWDFSNIFRFFTGILLGLIAGLVFASPSGRRISVLFLAITASASGVAAIFQQLGYGAWSVSRTVYALRSTYVPSGLERNPVAYSYSVLPVLIVLISSSMVQFRNRIRLQTPTIWIAYPLGILIVLGLFFSNSRSGLMGFALGMVVVALGARALRFKFIPLFLWLLLLAGLTTYAFSIKSEESAIQGDRRFITTWQAYLPVALEYPFGKPTDLENVAVLEMVYYRDLDHTYVQTLNALREIAPHNIFLTTAVEFGIFAAFGLSLLYLTTIIAAIRSFFRYVRLGMRNSAIWLAILLAANISLLVHAWFHNANLVTGEMRGWIWLGALLASIRFDIHD